MGYVDSLLAKNENIVFQTRQHVRVLFGSAAANTFIFTIFCGLLLFGGSIPFISGSQLRGILTLVLFVLALLPLVAFMRDFLEWWNEDYVVTNRRVIQAGGILGKHLIDSSLDKVNDVVLSQSFLGRLFDYGDIEILTASETGVNYFRTIAEPVKFKMAMLNQREASPSPSNPPIREQVADIEALMKELDELHQQGVLNDQEYRDKKRQLFNRMKIN